MRRIRFPVVLLVALSFVGCGSPAALTSSPMASVAPTASAVPSVPVQPTPSGSPDLAPFALQYAAIATTATAVVTTCAQDKSAAGGDLTKEKAAAQACLAAVEQVVSQGSGINWGPVQPQADDFRSALQTLEATLAQMAAATDSQALQAAYAKLVSAELRLKVSADAMRAALGLPPAP